MIQLPLRRILLSVARQFRSIGHRPAEPTAKTAFRVLAVAAAPLYLVSAVGQAWAQDKLEVVASFSILGDMVAQIGGDRVAVTTLVGPNGDAHGYEPTPRVAKIVSGADVVVVNGLGFEGWLPRLIEASGFHGAEVVASSGITPHALEENEGEHGGAAHDGDAHEEHDDAGHEGHDHGGVDPHAWQSLANGMVYARNIAAGLEKADPANAAYYAERSATYETELADLDAELKREFAAVPADRRKVVTSHDAFGYFADAYGIEFIAPEGVSTESEASAADVARIIRQIRDEGIKAVFVENISNRQLLEQIASETGATIGGTLYSDALSDRDGPAATYVEMFRNNARQLLDALVVS